MFVFDVGQGGS